MRVAVALTSFNGSAFLPDQLATILAQSRPVDRIVVADDGSTDATPQILDGIVRANPDRVWPLPAVRHQGLAVNVARALAAAADAEVVFLCDQDDLWRPTKVEQMLEALDGAPDALLAFSDAQLIDEQGRPLGQTLFAALGMAAVERAALAGDKGFEVLLRRNLVTGATVALRRELLEMALPVPDGLWHDEWLALVAAAHGRLLLLDQCLIDYRRHAAATTLLHPRVRLSPWREKLAAYGHKAQRQARRLQVVESGFRRSGRAVPAVALAAVQAHRLHWQARAAIPAARLDRVPTVWRELRLGRYRRCSSGWPSALRDLLRQVVPDTD